MLDILNINEVKEILIKINENIGFVCTFVILYIIVMILINVFKVGLALGNETNENNNK